MKSYVVFLSVCTSAVLKKQKNKTKQKKSIWNGEAINHMVRVEG